METVPLHTALIHPSPHKITSERCQTISSTLNFFTLYKYKEREKKYNNNYSFYIYPFAIRWRQSGTNKGSA